MGSTFRFELSCSTATLLGMFLSLNDRVADYVANLARKLFPFPSHLDNLALELSVVENLNGELSFCFTFKLNNGVGEGRIFEDSRLNNLSKYFKLGMNGLKLDR